MKRSRIVLLLVIVAIFASVGAALYLFNKKVPGLENKKPDVVITADDLFNAFETDENEARLKFEDRIIQVSGEVLRIHENEDGFVIVLKAENSFTGGVNCSFSNIPEGVKAGQSVTIKGLCQGFLMDVVLNNCVIVNTGF